MTTRRRIVNSGDKDGRDWHPAGFVRLKSLYFEGAYGTGSQDGNDRTLQALIGRYYVSTTTFLGFRYDEAEIKYSAGVTTSFQSMSVQIGTGL